MSVMDFLDDFIFGPLNYFDRLEGLVSGAIYRDLGYQMAVLYPDRGGRHTRDEVEALLRHYGIAVYGRTHDAQHMYFRVKKRQARWAEYLLLHANVALTSPTFDQRNQGYLAKHEAGWMPKAWADQKKSSSDTADREPGFPKPPQPAAPSFWQRFDRMLDQFFK